MIDYVKTGNKIVFAVVATPAAFYYLFKKRSHVVHEN